jgi:hypothetical protein
MGEKLVIDDPREREREVEEVKRERGLLFFPFGLMDVEPWITKYLHNYIHGT